MALELESLLCHTPTPALSLGRKIALRHFIRCDVQPRLIAESEHALDDLRRHLEIELVVNGSPHAVDDVSATQQVQWGSSCASLRVL